MCLFYSVVYSNKRRDEESSSVSLLVAFRQLNVSADTIFSGFILLVSKSNSTIMLTVGKIFKNEGPCLAFLCSDQSTNSCTGHTIHYLSDNVFNSIFLKKL